jgi:hypothetical protein
LLFLAFLSFAASRCGAKGIAAGSEALQNTERWPLVLRKLDTAKKFLLECVVIVHICPVLALAVAELWHVFRLF